MQTGTKHGSLQTRTSLPSQTTAKRIGCLVCEWMNEAEFRVPWAKCNSLQPAVTPGAADTGRLSSDHRRQLHWRANGSLHPLSRAICQERHFLQPENKVQQFHSPHIIKPTLRHSKLKLTDTRSLTIASPIIKSNNISSVSWLGTNKL